MRLNELWTCSDDRAVVVGPFEEEEEKISIASEVNLVKLQGEDPDTPGSLTGDRVRRDIRDRGSWGCPPWLTGDETPGP